MTVPRYEYANTLVTASLTFKVRFTLYSFINEEFALYMGVGGRGAPPPERQARERKRCVHDLPRHNLVFTKG